MSCPSAALCIGVDDGGHVLASSDPESAAGAWSAANVDAAPLLAVSCAAADLCVAGDDQGNVLSSTDPAGGGGAWTAVHVDGNNEITAVSCVTGPLCVATDSADHVLTSTDPTGGAWHLTPLTYGLEGVSCTSGALCVAATDYGSASVSTNPGGGASAWTSFEIDPNEPLFGISCPSSTFCIAVGFPSIAVTTTAPTGGARAWTARDLGLGENGLAGVSCASASLCVAFSADRQAFQSSDPSGGPSQWMGVTTAQGPVAGIIADSCPAVAFCLAGDGRGDVYLGSGPPVPASTSPPRISGTAEQGRSLHLAAQGSWTNDPAAFTYRWERCNRNGGGCSPIEGATGRTYKVREGDVGHTLRLLESASSGAGTGSALSDQSDVVSAPLQVTIGAGRVLVSGTAARVEVACSNGRPGSICRGTVSLSIRRGGHELAHARYAIASGARRLIAMRVNTHGLISLRQAHADRRRIDATATLRGGADASRKVTVRLSPAAIPDLRA